MGEIERRQFLLCVAVLLSTPFASAQGRGTLRRVAVLTGGTTDPAWVAALRENLGQLGWIEDRNVVIDYRWGEGDAALMRKHAADLVSRKPDVMLVRSATALREARRAAGEIPIVFVSVSDPVGNGFVQSLAHPGGNITGFSNLDYDMAGKFLQLLKEVAPHVKRVFVLQSPNNPNWPGWLRAIDASASTLKLEVVRGSVTDGAQIEPTISAFARESNGGLLVLPDPFLRPQRDLIFNLAKRFRLPAVYGGGGFDNGKGLIYYGVDDTDFARQAALYVSRILNGEKAGTLPVQAPTKFKLHVSANVAKTLGLTLPASILVRADKVIE
jgi:putative ABC transport system substrate-binding protein